MDTTYIEPFAESVRKVFTTMARTAVTVGEPTTTDDLPACDASAVISYSGEVTGAAMLCFSSHAATAIVAKFTCAPCKFGSADCSDALGEIANMVCGAAKARFIGKRVSISTPSVVLGTGRAFPTDHGARVLLPCHTQLGNFSIVIAVHDSQVQRAA